MVYPKPFYYHGKQNTTIRASIRFCLGNDRLVVISCIATKQEIVTPNNHKKVQTEARRHSTRDKKPSCRYDSRPYCQKL